jgi:hypothetical protein
MNRSIGLFVLTALVFACGASQADDGDANGDVGEDDITGVQDLGALETELALTKDQRGANGQWKRPDAKLTAGGCYKQTKGSATPNDFEFRRYTEGAVFFRKLGAAPGAGDERPVLCLDLDIRGRDNVPETVTADRFEIDVMMRYDLGREQAAEGALGTEYFQFARGAMRVVDAIPVPPGTTDSLDTPLFRGGTFGGIDLGRAGENDPINPSLAKLVFRFAWKDAKAEDKFTLHDDPVGKFVSSEWNGGTIQRIRYEHLDAHFIRSANTEALYITPKQSDTNLAANAAVTCTRNVDGQGKATTKFQCSGL